MARSLTNVFLVLLVLAGALLWATIDSASYLHVRLKSPELELVKSGKPSAGIYWFGEPIPLVYRLQRQELDVTIAVDSTTFIPSLRIDSNQPIERVTTELCALTVSSSDLDALISWGTVRGTRRGSCVFAGDPVLLEIVFAGRPETIVIRGTVEESGWFLFNAL